MFHEVRVGKWFGAVLCCLFAMSAAQADSQFPFPYSKNKPLLESLRHPSEATTNTGGSLNGRLFKPEGNGPFPAVILQHTCGGVSEHLRQWVKEAVARGYVAYVIDSFTPRGVTMTCGAGKDTKVLPTDGMVDVLGAARHLAKLPFVAPQRIAHVGFSWGAGVALFENSTWFRSEPKYSGYTDVKLNASVALYPACFHPKWGKIPDVSFVQPDVAVPTLALIAEHDHEDPVDLCLKQLEAAKGRGALYTWQVMKGATHGWDAAEKDGLTTKQPWMDSSGTYRYDASITRMSMKLTFDFLGAQLR